MALIRTDGAGPVGVLHFVQHDTSHTHTRQQRAHVGHLRALLLVEHYGFLSIQQDAVFKVPAYGAREHDLFEVAAFLNQIFDRIAM